MLCPKCENDKFQMYLVFVCRVDDMRLMEKLLHIVSATKQEDFVTSFSQAKSSLNGYSHAGDTIPNLILKSKYRHSLSMSLHNLHEGTK